jgi:hypothetical protein
MVQQPHFLLETKWLSTSSAVLLGLVITLFTATNGMAQWATSGNDISNTNTGKVAVGTTSPSRKFQVSGDAVRFERSGQSIEVNPNYALGNTHAAIAILENVPLRFILYDNVTSLMVMHLDTTGNVGIGTTTPSTRLHVVGDVTVTGNIAAKYQDVAEWVPARRPMPAGTVMVLDTERSNQVMASSSAYDTRVAGVISETPGILLGEAGEGKTKVASTGRVKVRVDATQKPIRVGDLLVTSDSQGMAMRSEPLDLGGIPIHRPGTIIGKALEPMTDGEGEILILLTLQ